MQAHFHFVYSSAYLLSNAGAHSVGQAVSRCEEAAVHRTGQAPALDGLAFTGLGTGAWGHE